MDVLDTFQELQPSLRAVQLNRLGFPVKLFFEKHVDVESMFNYGVPMTQFKVSQLKDAAAYYRDLASRLDAAAESLSKVNPNVLIVIGEQANNGSSATGVEQIKEVLKKAGKPLRKKEIEKALNGSVKPDTLASYLSKNRGIFSNPSRGVWGLAEEIDQKAK